jgi:hypothetical protein
MPALCAGTSRRSGARSSTPSPTHRTGLTSLAVDAWGCDYALLDDRGDLVERPYHYRDPRTDGAMAAVFARVPRDEIMAIAAPAVPGAAEAVRQAGRTDVKVMGLSLPNINKKCVHEDVVQVVML